jgi:hypothetical protein
VGVPGVAGAGQLKFASEITSEIEFMSEILGEGKFASEITSGDGDEVVTAVEGADDCAY